jgi:hypothetical protein
MTIAGGRFDKINMLVSFNVKMAIICLTCHPEIMVSVMETIVVRPVILASKAPPAVANLRSIPLLLSKKVIF